MRILVMAQEAGNTGNGPNLLDVLTVVAATVGVLLGIWNWWEIRLSRRIAALTARHEHFEPRAAAPERFSNFDRLVITNAGHATARNVGVQVLSRTKEGEFKPTQLSSRWELPIPELHAGQHFMLHMVITVGGNYPDAVELTWHDRRRSQQRRRVYLSTEELLG